jgi:hypothetical protein
VKSQVEQLQISLRDLLESNCVLNEHISKQDEESTRENERRDHIKRELDSVQSKLKFKKHKSVRMPFCPLRLMVILVSRMRSIFHFTFYLDVCTNRTLGILLRLRTYYCFSFVIPSQGRSFSSLR